MNGELDRRAAKARRELSEAFEAAGRPVPPVARLLRRVVRRRALAAGLAGVALFVGLLNIVDSDAPRESTVVAAQPAEQVPAPPVEQVPAPPVAPPSLAPEPGGPPPVTLRFDQRSESVKAFSFCWTGEPGATGIRQAVCADGMPSPDPLVVDGASEVLIDFPLSGFEFNATFQAPGNPCGRSQAVSAERRGDRSFVLRPAGRAGSYDVFLEAKGGDSASYHFRWNTPSNGVLPTPEARLAIISRHAPDGSYGIEMAISNLDRTPDEVKATVTVTASNGRSVAFEPTRAANQCSPEGSLYWDGPADRGKAAAKLGSEPYTYDVILILDGVRHVARASWPADQIVGNEPSVTLTFEPPLPRLT